MKYDLLVISFNNNRAKMIIARQLAHDPSISLQKAQTIVDKPPFILLKNLTPQELEFQSQQLRRMGVNFKAVELKSDTSINIPPVLLPPDDLNIKQLLQNTPTVKPGKIKTHTSNTVPKTIGVFEDNLQINKKKNYALLISVFPIIISVVLVVLGFFISNKRQYNIKKTTALITRTDHRESSKSGKSEKHSRQQISAKAKKESITWTDSAIAYQNDYLRAINFYKIAISFNKYNIKAWYGLLDIYNAAMMQEEIEQTKNKMKEIFGESIFSVSEIIKPFGKLIDSYTTDDQVFRLEYRTQQSGQHNIINETFIITKALKETCKCKAISIFASTSSAKGLIVHIKANASIATIETYKKKAVISYLE